MIVTVRMTIVPFDKRKGGVIKHKTAKVKEISL